MRILIVIYFMINWDDWDYILLHERVFKKFKSAKFHKTHNYMKKNIYIKYDFYNITN